MINQQMTERGQNSSVIRELFEFGKQRKAIVGEDKVFDFSIGNPSVPCPEKITECMIKLLQEEEPVAAAWLYFSSRRFGHPKSYC